LRVHSQIIYLQLGARYDRGMLGVCRKNDGDHDYTQGHGSADSAEVQSHLHS